MASFTIIDAKPWHCGQMVRLLRHEHSRALSLLGADAHKELRAMFAASYFRRAWMIDGTLAALGGVAGTALSRDGFLWLALAERARRYPVAIVKEARAQLDRIMTLKRELGTTILGDDAAALRLAVFLGFHVSHAGDGVRAETRLMRRVLMTHAQQEPQCRIPVAAGYVIAMGYHHEEAA